MNLEVPIGDVDHLFICLCKKLDVSLNKGGFMTMGEKIEGVDTRYLSEKLYGKMISTQNKGGKSFVVRKEKLDLITQYLGFDNFQDFQDSLKIDLDLLKFEGSYYSYVRKGDQNSEVLKSPVLIKKVGNEIQLLLKGKDRTFNGRLELMNGCIYCLMKSTDKSFYHIYKVGKANTPKVIQGIFSGVSSADNPIGGRCILIRENLEFGQLNNSKIAIAELLSSSDSDQKKIGVYFMKFEENNLKINAPNGFDIDDLA